MKLKLNRVSKKAIVNMLITSAAVALVINLIALTVWFALIRPEMPQKLVQCIYFLVVAFLDIILFISPFIRYPRYRYSIDDVSIVKKEGIIFVSTEIAPIERVHQITVKRGPIDNLTGLAKVVATTAGGEIVIRFLELEVAFELANSLAGTIKGIVKEQANDHEKQ